MSKENLLAGAEISMHETKLIIAKQCISEVIDQNTVLTPEQKENLTIALNQVNKTVRQLNREFVRLETNEDK